MPRLPVSSGTDAPVVPYPPLWTLYHFVTRDTISGGVLGADQSVTSQQALRIATMGNAWLTMEERSKGSIEAGKLADLVVLIRRSADRAGASTARRAGADDDCRRTRRARPAEVVCGRIVANDPHHCDPRRLTSGTSTNASSARRALVGQNVNKVATPSSSASTSGLVVAADVKARLTSLAGSRMSSAGVLLIDSREFRTQAQNREAAPRPPGRDESGRRRWPKRALLPSRDVPPKRRSPPRAALNRKAGADEPAPSDD